MPSSLKITTFVTVCLAALCAAKHGGPALDAHEGADNAPSPRWVLNTSQSHQTITKGGNVPGLGQLVMVPNDSSDELLYVYDAVTGVLQGTRPRVNISFGAYQVLQESPTSETVHIVSQFDEGGYYTDANVMVTTYANWKDEKAEPVQTILTNNQTTGYCSPAPSAVFIKTLTSPLLVLAMTCDTDFAYLLAFNVSSRTLHWNTILTFSSDVDISLVAAGSGVIVTQRTGAATVISLVDGTSGTTKWSQTYAGNSSAEEYVDVYGPVVRQDEPQPTHLFFVEWLAASAPTTVNKMALATGTVVASLQLSELDQCTTTAARTDSILVLFCKCFEPKDQSMKYLLYVSTETMQVVNNVTLEASSVDQGMDGWPTAYDPESDILLVNYRQPTAVVAVHRATGNVMWNVAVPLVSSLKSILYNSGLFIISGFFPAAPNEYDSRGSVAYAAANP